jgi:diaminohydroxyphosphoribosylaminopyrimidine deaminase / 5-amino-6-(5-phosphoribosylamino)uracil reductase
MANVDYMKQALSLARLAIGEVSPNPAVGALIIHKGEIIGQGYTQPPGFAHAEIVALQQAGDKAKGSTLYSTLEPCCHYGRTPPCTRAIITAGISEVHFAMIDPNPQVNGKGKTELENNGIKVLVGESASEASTLNEAYIKYITKGIPFVTAKFAVSLDGKIATRTGDSRWISGEDSRKYVHYLRYANDAIMVGVNTVIADDPSLITKCCGGRGGMAKQQPLRIIVDSKARTPSSAKVFAQPGNTLIVHGKINGETAAAYSKTNIELLELPAKRGFVDTKQLLQILGKRNITSVLVEGGGTLLGSLFDQNQVDKVIAFISPVIIGGTHAKTPVSGKGVANISDAYRLKHVNTERIGEDVMITGYVKE